MNQLQGIVVEVQSNGHLSLVDVRVGDDTFTSIVLETPDNTPYLKAGSAVALLFKATEVSLAKNLSGLISTRNRMAVVVQGIRRGELISEVALDYRGQPFSSVITTRALDRLALAVGDNAEALVKANEMSLMEVPDAV